MSFNENRFLENVNVELDPINSPMPPAHFTRNMLEQNKKKEEKMSAQKAVAQYKSDLYDTKLAEVDEFLPESRRED